MSSWGDFRSLAAGHSWVFSKPDLFGPQQLGGFDVARLRGRRCVFGDFNAAPAVAAAPGY
jgi:hypothetical protein